jgi:hypothetical protein
MLTGAQPGWGASTVVVVVGGTVVVVVGGTVVVGELEVEGADGEAGPPPAEVVPEHAAAITTVAVTTVATPTRATQDRRRVSRLRNWCTGDVYHCAPAN